MTRWPLMVSCTALCSSKILCKIYTKTLQTSQGWRGSIPPGTTGLLFSGCGVVAGDCLASLWSLTSGALSSATLLNHPEAFDGSPHLRALGDLLGILLSWGRPTLLHLHHTTKTGLRLGGVVGGREGCLEERLSLCVCTTLCNNWKLRLIPQSLSTLNLLN